MNSGEEKIILGHRIIQLLKKINNGECESLIKASLLKVIFSSDDLLILKEKRIWTFLKSLLFIPYASVMMFLLFTDGIESLRTFLIVFIMALITVPSAVLSLFDIMTKGYVRVDKSRQIVEVYKGTRKFFFTPLIIPFNDIKSLLVGTVHIPRAAPAMDSLNIIKLILKNGKSIDIEKSRDDSYIIDLTNKLSSLIGCEANYTRWDSYLKPY